MKKVKMIEEYRCSLKHSTPLNDESLTDKIKDSGGTYGRINRQCERYLKKNPCMYYRKMFGYELCLFNYDVEMVKRLKDINEN